MLDIGWSELMVIGALALIVVGPKDLPRLLRGFGKYVNQMRGMARDFQRSMEDAAREADISDMKELRDAAKSLNDIKRMPFDTVTRPGAAKPAATAAASPIPPSPKPAAPAPQATSSAPQATSPAPQATSPAPQAAPVAASPAQTGATPAPAPTEGA